MVRHHNGVDDVAVVVRNAGTGEEHDIAVVFQADRPLKDAAWSYDGSVIASGTSPFIDGWNSDIIVAATDGSWVRNLTEDEPAEGPASWSPTDMRLVFVSQRDRSKPDLYLADVESLETVRLTHNEAYEHGAVWLSGDRFVYIKNGDLHFLSVSDRVQTPLTSVGSYFTSVQGFIRLPVSPDRRCVAPLFDPDGGSADSIRVRVICLDEAEVVDVVDVGPGIAAQWSGDPRFILVVRTTEPHIWMIDLETGMSAPFPAPPSMKGLPKWRPRP